MEFPIENGKLRVLWFTGMPIGDIKPGEKLTHGGWMSELQKHVEGLRNVELGIAFQSVDSVFGKVVGKTTYYTLTKKLGIWRSLNRFLFYKNQETIELQKMLQVIQDFQPDIIHVFGTESVYGLIASCTNIPTVIHLQGLLIPCVNAWFPPWYSKNDLKGFNRRFSYYVNKYQAEREKRIFSGCRYFMGRTEWDKNVARLFSPNSTYFHCNEMLRSEFYDVPPAHREKCDKKPHLISVISTPFYKGHDLILKTAKLLKQQLSLDFEWKVYGVFELQQHERKWGISAAENNVCFMGRVSGGKLRKRMEQSDIYVHPSYIDNSPNSVCEAQLLGLPVVACNVGGVSSLITTGQDGILLPANDPYQLAMYIAKLRNCPELYQTLSRSGRDTALTRHDPDRILSDLVNIYQRMICRE